MALANRIRYRLWQFWQVVAARPLSDQAWQDIGRLLTEPEQALFQRQSTSARQHSFRVMEALRAAGHERPELLAAALLHDIGKTCYPRHWWERPLVVLGPALLPAQTARWAAGRPQGWSRPFVVKARHSEWGAGMAAAAGCSELTVRLIRRHHEVLDGTINEQTDEDRQVALLQWADDQS